MEEFLEEDEEEFDEEEEFGDEEDEVTPLSRHMALLTKNDLIALLLLQTYEDSGVIVRLDPREENPAASRYTDARAAEMFFNRSLRTSEKNGWSVAWEGEPVIG